MECPLLSRIAPIRGHVTEPVPGLTDELGFPIPSQIKKSRRLIVHDVEHTVSRPVAGLLAGIAKPGGIFAGETHDQDILPAVPIEVVDEGKEVVGVLAHVERVWRIDLVAPVEPGALVPVGPGDHIQVAVPVEIAEGGTLRMKFIGELKAFEVVEQVLIRDHRGCEDHGHAEHEGAEVRWSHG